MLFCVRRAELSVLSILDVGQSALMQVQSRAFRGTFAAAPFVSREVRVLNTADDSLLAVSLEDW